MEQWMMVQRGRRGPRRLRRIAGLQRLKNCRREQRRQRALGKPMRERLQQIRHEFRG
jgi:hypothetical protein